MSADAPGPDALRGPVLVVAALFAGYTVLSVTGLVTVKKWLPAAQSSISHGQWVSTPVWWAAGGAFAYIVSFLLWMGFVTRAPLSVAYPIAVGTTLCLTVLASLIIFNERPTGVQLVGCIVVLLGIMMIASGLQR